MALLLALIAIVVTAGACVLTWRARRTAHNLALEMIELRDRLATAERAHLEAASERASTGLREDGEDEAILSRMSAFEARMRSTMETAARSHSVTAPAGDEALDAPRLRVIKHLEQSGYENVAVLEIRKDGGMVVEAERRGIATKGHAFVEPDGRVRLKFRTSLRAFP